MKYIVKYIFAGLAIAIMAVPFLAASAQAQSVGGGGFGGHKHQLKADQTAEQKPKVDEKAYNAVLKNLPDKTYDPWHGMR